MVRHDMCLIFQARKNNRLVAQGMPHENETVEHQGIYADRIAGGRCHNRYFGGRNDSKLPALCNPRLQCSGYSRPQEFQGQYGVILRG